MLRKSAVVAAIVAVVAACGPGGASQPPSAKIDPQVSLSVEVCTEGEARDTKIYFRNLNDFEWQAVSFSVSKGGSTYTLGEEPQSMQGGREKPSRRGNLSPPRRQSPSRRLATSLSDRSSRTAGLLTRPR